MDRTRQSQGRSDTYLTVLLTPSKQHVLAFREMLQAILVSFQRQVSCSISMRPCALTPFQNQSQVVLHFAK